MKLKFVHFSDWHCFDFAQELPECDAYICTGDMLPNKWLNIATKNIDREIKSQKRWMEYQNFREKYFKSPNAPVFCVRGNHDFTEIAPLFKDGEVHEIVKPNDFFMFNGLKIGGMRGINFMGGYWADELTQKEFDLQVEMLPKNLDIILTHSPLYKILDKGFSEHYGSHSLYEYFYNCCYDSLNYKLPKVWTFGHVHESNGIVRDKTIFSNAATTFNVIEIEV